MVLLIFVEFNWKQANVVMSPGGDAQLCDFGLAVIIEDLVEMPISSALDGAGNPRWMAPELFMGCNMVSKESDVWAFGMTVLEVRASVWSVTKAEDLILRTCDEPILLDHDP